jgi:ABC-2 type transport system permease protein
VAVFVCAVLLGFHSQGPLALAVVVGLAVSFSAIGQGLIVACFVANDSQAVNYGSVFSMLQVFISGSFFPMPAPTWLTIAGHEMSLFDLCPATHGMLLLQQVMCYGAGWGEIGFRLVAMLALSLLYFAAGVFVFQRLQMRQT